MLTCTVECLSSEVLGGFKCFNSLLSSGDSEEGCMMGSKVYLRFHSPNMPPPPLPKAAMEHLDARSSLGSHRFFFYACGLFVMVNDTRLMNDTVLNGLMEMQVTHKISHNAPLLREGHKCQGVGGMGEGGDWRR